MRPIDWDKLFSLEAPFLEIVVRGSVVYLSLFFLLRYVLKRQAGSVGITDLLVVVLIADAAQNSMAKRAMTPMFVVSSKTVMPPCPIRASAAA